MAHVQRVMQKYRISLVNGEDPLITIERAVNERNLGKRVMREFLKAYAEDNANEFFDNLPKLNECLERLGKRSEDSLTKARASLRTIHINIYDLLAGRWVVHNSVRALRKYTLSNKLVFPKDKAKSQGLRDFLRRLN
jgi:hypothetical protein